MFLNLCLFWVKEISNAVQVSVPNNRGIFRVANFEKFFCFGLKPDKLAHVDPTCQM